MKGKRCNAVELICIFFFQFNKLSQKPMKYSQLNRTVRLTQNKLNNQLKLILISRKVNTV